jgi:hypothetical protein
MVALSYYVHETGDTTQFVITSCSTDRDPLWCRQVLFIFIPYKDAVGISEYIGLKDLMIMNNKLEIICKESMWPNLRHISKFVRRNALRIHENPQCSFRKFKQNFSRAQTRSLTVSKKLLTII